MTGEHESDLLCGGKLQHDSRGCEVPSQRDSRKHINQKERQLFQLLEAAPGFGEGW